MSEQLDYHNPQYRFARGIPWCGLVSLLAPTSTIALIIAKLSGYIIFGFSSFEFILLPVVGLACGIAGLRLDQKKAAATSGLTSNLLLLFLIAALALFFYATCREAVPR